MFSIKLLLTLGFASAVLEAKTFRKIGGVQKESCQESHFGLGKPVNSFNHVVSVIQSYFGNDAKNLKLLHFSSRLGAGTVYNSLFKVKQDSNDRFVAIKIFVPLPVHDKDPEIETLLITKNKGEALKALGIKEKQAKEKKVCQTEFSKDFSKFSLKDERERVAKRFKQGKEVFEHTESKTSTIKPAEKNSDSQEKTALPGVGENLVSFLDRIGGKVGLKFNHPQISPSTLPATSSAKNESEFVKIDPNSSEDQSIYSEEAHQSHIDQFPDQPNFSEEDPRPIVIIRAVPMIEGVNQAQESSPAFNQIRFTKSSEEQPTFFEEPVEIPQAMHFVTKRPSRMKRVRRPSYTRVQSRSPASIGFTDEFPTPLTLLNLRDHQARKTFNRAEENGQALMKLIEEVESEVRRQALKRSRRTRRNSFRRIEGFERF